MRALDAIGVAANNAYGATTVSVMDPITGDVLKNPLERERRGYRPGRREASTTGCRPQGAGWIR